MFRFKRAEKSEIDAIQMIADATWRQTYQSILSQDQIDYMLNLMYTKKALEEQFAEGHLFYFAYNEWDLAGFACLKNVEEDIWKLQKIYVMPLQQGKGVGKALLEFSINKVRSLGANQLLLNVNRNNKARFFYERNGFAIKENVDINIGNGYFMNDYLMSLQIENSDQ